MTHKRGHTLTADERAYIEAQMSGLEGPACAAQAKRLAQMYAVGLNAIYRYSMHVRPRRRTRADKKLLDTDIRRLLEKANKTLDEYDSLIALLQNQLRKKALTPEQHTRLSCELRGALKDRVDLIHRLEFQRRTEKLTSATDSEPSADDAPAAHPYENGLKALTAAAILSDERVLADVLGLRWFRHYTKMARHERAHPKRNIVFGPRGGGKSMKRTVLNPIKRLLRNFELSILITSDVEDQATDSLFLIALHLQNNETLNWVFGNFYDGKHQWNENRIVIAQRRGFYKEGSIEAWGSRQRGYHGKHYDVIMPDDFTTEENSATEHGRARTKRTYEKRLYFCTKARTNWEWTATVWHPKDLVVELSENGYKDATLVIQGIQVDSLGRERSFCSELFPLDTRIDPETNEEITGLRDIRSDIGSVAFETQIQGNPRVMRGNIILEEWIQYYDDEPEGLRVYQGVDPAVGVKKQNAYSVIITIGVKQRGRLPLIYVIDVCRRKTSPLRFLQVCAMKFNQYDPIRLGWETNAYQAAGEQFARELGNIRTKSIHTDKDKITRAQKNSAIFEDGRVFVKRDQPWTAGFVQRLVALQEDAEWWDEVDALDIAIKTGAKTGAMVH